MSAPTPIGEKYVPCIESTFTIGTSPSTTTLEVIDGGYTRSFGVDEMTNNKSGAAYEDVKTYRSVEGSFTCAYVSGAVLAFEDGDIFPVVIDNPHGPYLACNARFNQVELPILDVKSGLKYKFKLKNQGAITTARPAP